MRKMRHLTQHRRVTGARRQQGSRTGMSIKRRLPALAAAVAIAGGLAVSTAGVAGAATDEPAKCVSSNGKYHATLVKSFKIMGRDSEGNVTERGGTLQVYRSAR